MGNVPVAAKVVEVKLAGGGVAMVRRVRRSTLADIMEAADYKENSPAAQARFGELLVRRSVESYMNVADPETGEVIANTRVEHKVLGPIASREFYDSIADADVARIIDAANGKLSEAAQGN